MSQDQDNVGIVKSTGSSYLWEVKNFCIACKNTGDSLNSPVFSTMGSSIIHKWRLELNPRGFKEEHKDSISIFVKYMGEDNVEVNVTLSLLDDKYCKVIERNFKLLYEKGSMPWGYPYFVKQNFVTEKTNRVLVNDTINILCEIVYDSNLAEPLKKKDLQENLPDYCRLKEFDEFEKLLEAENSTDITIRIGEKTIKAHKAIIMSRSPVFQTMFEHNMKEKEKSVVEITDIKYEVMKEVFRFMYVGKVYQVEKIAGDLLVAADKYSIKGLKDLSEKQLFTSLAVKNAIEYLKLADMCNAINLKSQIIKFIVSNQKNIVDKPELQLLPAEVMCEVLRAVVADSSNKFT